MDSLPTPEELGAKLKAGEITKEEAIEIMSERARRDAFSGIYPPAPQDKDSGETKPDGLPSRSVAGETKRKRVFAVVCIALIIIYVLNKLIH